MKHLNSVLSNKQVAESLIRNGLDTIKRKHTCDHRLEALFAIVNELKTKKSQHMTVSTLTY